LNTSSTPTPKRNTTMALQEARLALPRALRYATARQLRFASTATAKAPIEDLEVSSLNTPSLTNEKIKEFNPVSAAESIRAKLPRKAFRGGTPKQLPPGRYVSHPLFQILTIFEDEKAQNGCFCKLLK
jgi:hypothetical protein